MMLLEIYGLFFNGCSWKFMDCFFAGCYRIFMDFFMDVAGILWFFIYWMLLEVYGLFHVCYWKFMDFYLIDVTGNLWICSWILL